MKKRRGDPWMSPADYGRTLEGLSLNLIVRDVERSVPFYATVLGMRVLYHDPDFAALARDGARVQLHADHTYEAMPWAVELARGARRGLGAEIRILGIDPEAAERAARGGGWKVVVPTRTRAHGWRDCHVEDPDGYVFAVGVPSE